MKAFETTKRPRIALKTGVKAGWMTATPELGVPRRHERVLTELGDVMHHDGETVAGSFSSRGTRPTCQPDEGPAS